MEQIFIRVGTLKDGKVECIDKDIRECNEKTRMQYYYSQSKGQLMGLLELYVKDTKGQK